MQTWNTSASPTHTHIKKKIKLICLFQAHCSNSENHLELLIFHPKSCGPNLCMTCTNLKTCKEKQLEVPQDKMSAARHHSPGFAVRLLVHPEPPSCLTSLTDSKVATVALWSILYQTSWCNHTPEGRIKSVCHLFLGGDQQQYSGMQWWCRKK